MIHPPPTDEGNPGISEAWVKLYWHQATLVNRLGGSLVIIEYMPINYPQHGNHSYYSYRSRRYSPPRKNRWWIPVLLLIIAVCFIFFLYNRPIASITPTEQMISTAVASQVNIIWPTGSQAAIGSEDEGVLAVKPNQIPKPTASTAKLITALVVLKNKPLKVGEKGPKITLTQHDVDIYNQYFTKDGSTAKVAVGEQLTEYQMLQGMLLPSANNYADSLAIWAYGSLENYQQAAQRFVRGLDMTHTTIGNDASGFAPTTVSTAEDLTKLAATAIKNPVVAEIVKQDQVNLPVAGVKQNTNWLLSAEGVIGLKTGDTKEAGGVYVFASKYDVDKKHSTIIIGAAQGEPDVLAAIHQSRGLLNQVRPQFKLVTPIKKGQLIASYHSAWGERVQAVAASDIQVVGWVGKKITPKISLFNVMVPAAKSSSVGIIKIGNVSTKIILKDQINLPNWQWRMFR